MLVAHHGGGGGVVAEGQLAVLAGPPPERLLRPSSRKFGKYRASFIDRPPQTTLDIAGLRSPFAHHYVAHISTHDQLALDRCASPPGTSTVDPWHPGWQPPRSMRARCGGADDRHALEPDRGPHRQVSAARVPELAGSSRRAPVPRPRRPVGLVGGRPGPVLELHRRLLRGRVLDAVDDGAHRRSDAARPLVQRRPVELGPARTAPGDRRRHGAGVRPGGWRTGARDHPRGPSPIRGGSGGLAAPDRRAPG